MLRQKNDQGTRVEMPEENKIIGHAVKNAASGYLLAMLSRLLSLAFSPLLSPGSPSRLSSERSDILETREEATADGVDRPLPPPPADVGVVPET